VTAPSIGNTQQSASRFRAGHRLAAFLATFLATAAPFAVPYAAAAPASEPPLSTPDSATLQVAVVPPDGGEGVVALALFDDRESFDAGARELAVRTATIRLADGAGEWRVEDLPPGVYALKAYLDRNGNGRLDRGKLGIPSEPYGFSNEARGRVGPPSWEKARFAIHGPSAISVRLR
jgi:uncharacterized protein (DUF2141 family)